MDLDMFRFVPNPSSPTTLDGGQAISGYLSAMWVERYQDVGEFEIRATLGSGLKEFLPLDTFISRPCTFEVMMVENHEVIDDNDLDPILIITGRSMPAILDRRFVGIYQVRHGVNIQPNPYNVYSNYRSAQTVYMINEHINFSNDVDDRFDNVLAVTSITGESVQNTRTIKLGSLLEAVKSLCIADDQGFRTLRRSPFFIAGGSDTITIFNIYKGVDKSDSVIFSYERGDITRAHYLWTNKNYKTTMIVEGGKYMTYVEDGTKKKMDRRMGVMDASDLGDRYTEPGSVDLSWLNGDMQTRGFEQMANQKQLSMAQVDIAPLTNYFYRKDYGMGDLVMYDGNFGAIQKMRVIEHVEIEDETGSSSHPTLVLPPS